MIRGRSSFVAHHFLERDDVGVHLFQHSRDAFRMDAPVHAAALVNVVGCDSESMHGPESESYI